MTPEQQYFAWKLTEERIGLVTALVICAIVGIAVGVSAWQDRPKKKSK